MKFLHICTAFCVGALLYANASLAHMSVEEYEKAAEQQFNKSHQDYDSVPQEVDIEFEANLDYPASLETTERLWKNIDPYTEPQKYLESIFDHALKECGEGGADWDGKKCNWYHAPWFHQSREYMHGLTKERSSRPGELHPSQTQKVSNWAVGLYNDAGAYSLSKVWENKGYPKTDDFQFEDGTVSVKLLFTTATPQEVPYLRFAKEWKALISDRVQTVRLLQFDIAVKDSQTKKEHTGWLFGTFVFNGAIELTGSCEPKPQCEQARWFKRMVPVGLQWGNDPELTREAYTRGERVKEGWLNPDISELFKHVRLVSGHKPFLGRYGRVNGPVDNAKSSCLACHGRALDFGRALSNEEALEILPFVIGWDAEGDSEENKRRFKEDEKRFFRNLKSHEPFIEGMQSLDYSLQLSMGILSFRQWVKDLPVSQDIKDQTTDIEKVEFEDLDLSTTKIRSLQKQILQSSSPFSRGTE